MTLPVDYFERLYAAEPDPWGFGSRWYERRKYALTLAALPRERYRHVFEPGCSVGVLTAQLAGRCECLLALEPVARAATAAREAVAARTNVTVRIGSIPRDWPDGPFDLVVLSEVGYYLAPADLPSLADRLVRSLERAGTSWPCTGARTCRTTRPRPHWFTGRFGAIPD